MQMAIFEELVPRKARYLLRVAVGHFKDLQDSPPTDVDSMDSIIRLGLPIFLGDAITSAYARKPPLVTTEDLSYYFKAVGLHTPDFATDNLGSILDQHIPRQAQGGYVSHETLVSSTTLLACWLASAQREFAVMATYRSPPQPLSPAAIYRLWFAVSLSVLGCFNLTPSCIYRFVIDQIHTAVQRVQQLLVNITYLPFGCQSDGCADLRECFEGSWPDLMGPHLGPTDLRFDTRLDRDVMDVTYLLHVLIQERVANAETGGLGDSGDVLLIESDRRVRKSLKLVAFVYLFRLFFTTYRTEWCSLQLLFTTLYARMVLTLRSVSLMSSLPSDLSSHDRHMVRNPYFSAAYVIHVNLAGLPPSMAARIAAELPTPSSHWIFYSYVPDKAPVRSKMLYASTRATLLKNLGDTRIATAIFATSRADLTHSAYLSHLSHLSIDAPLTARESEMAELKAAERAEQIAGTDVSDGGRAGQPAWSGTVGLSWSGEAKALLKEFAKSRGEGDIVRLEVDTKKEEVVASNPQPTMLELPLETPSYSFLRHARGVVFIYSCPPSSPIKSRLLYSSSVGGVMQNAKALGVEVSKKIETSEPGEVTGDFVDAEFGPGSGTATPTDSAPMPASEEKKFAKPSRPGRRR
ncbi:twinfilin, partial [Phenoliferia sp. Uapishka_3]